MANPTIGFITCPITKENDCEVRRYSKGKKLLYYVSSAGMITPNLIVGQQYMKDNTRFINDNDKPLARVEDKTVNDIAPSKKPVNDNAPDKKPVKEKSIFKSAWDFLPDGDE